MAVTLRLPAWPGWHALPREARDTLFLLGVIAWTVLPHAGQLPLWCSLLTAAMLVWRALLALGSAPLPSRWVLLVALLLAMALTVVSHRSLVGKEAGVTLLVVLVALKTLELRARRDAMVVFFLGFFLVLTHFLYSQSIAIAAAMLVSVWGLLAALVLAHMPVGQPSLRVAGGLAARFALLGAPVMLVLFLLFPRIGPLWGVPADAGAKTGLSGTLRLGEVAELALDDSIAMRLRVLAGRTPAQEALYIRGPVLSVFDGTTWRMPSTRVAVTGQAVEAAPPGEPVELEVTLEPLRLPSLPLLELTPALPVIEGLRSFRLTDLHWMTDRPVTERLRFAATAWPRPRGAPLAGAASPQADELALPADSNPRLQAYGRALARETGGAAEALAARLLERMRREGYGYTLAPGLYDEDGSGDAIDEFWFDRKLGFCEHFAAGFVVAMRAAGVPARIVTGYQGAERNPIDGTLVVRQSHAHAWAEYWQAGSGWLRADPTAAVAPERIDVGRRLAAQPGFVAGALRGIAPDALLRLRAVWDAVNNRWNQWVLNYARGTQLDLLRQLGLQQPRWEDLAYLLIAIGSGAALLGAAWAWWDRRRVDPWLRAYARVRQAAAARGVAAGEALPPRALAQALRARHAGRAEAAARTLLQLEALRYAPGRAPAGATARAAIARRLAREAVQALRAIDPSPDLPT